MFSHYRNEKDYEEGIDYILLSSMPNLIYDIFYLIH